MITQHYVAIWLQSIRYSFLYTRITYLTTYRYTKKYQDQYRSWCKKKNFLSMLPEDTKARKAQIKEKLEQTHVNDHFAKAPPENKPEPYSDELFKEAAIQWLVETDQVRLGVFFLADFRSSNTEYFLAN